MSSNIQKKFREAARKLENQPEGKNADGFFFGTEYKLFRDFQGVGHVAIQCAAGKRVFKIKSENFESWYSKLWYQNIGKVLSPNKLRSILGTLAGFCLGTPPEKVFRRVAFIDGKIYLDMHDETGKGIVVDENGVRIRKDPMANFLPIPGGLPLPGLSEEAGLFKIRNYINYGNNEQLFLILGFLFGCFMPRGPYPILVVHGEQGSAKSTLLKVIRKLVAPNIAPVRLPPKDIRDLGVEAANTWLIVFDNLSFIPGWLSDALCLVSTEGAVTARKLYQDDELMILPVQRPVMVNGIEDFVTRDDLRDRCIFLELPTIEKKRVDEETLFKEWESDYPLILRGILDGVSHGLKGNKGEGGDSGGQNSEKTSRMADFSRFVGFCFKGLGLPIQEWEKLYRANRERQVGARFENSALAQTLLEVLGPADYVGSCTDLLRQLNNAASDDYKREKSWPKLPHQLSNQLKRLVPAAREMGLKITFSREGSGSRIINIEKKSIKEGTERR
ncbi:hypothetical protein UR09_02900 [Candidatus Nitromaritima sp. SCGC AAA799-A02]|nr:hypothetical protein UR09_02900 [Candidatus Nitromaritima sp. SCGC AAA799-A02]